MAMTKISRYFEAEFIDEARSEGGIWYRSQKDSALHLIGRVKGVRYYPKTGQYCVFEALPKNPYWNEGNPFWKLSGLPLLGCCAVLFGVFTVDAWEGGCAAPGVIDFSALVEPIHEKKVKHRRSANGILRTKSGGDDIPF